MARPNSRDPKKHPAALLGRRLSRLRVAAGFPTHEAAAKAFGYSRETITKVENGERTPTDQVFNTYLEKCNATTEQAESLREDLELARNAEPVVPEFAEPWLKVEPEATLIRIWGLDVMPGLMQTYDYALAMFVAGGMDEDRAAASAALRIKRQAILDGPEPTRLTVVLYEPLLRRRVGTPKIMAAELENLLALSQRPNIIIQVVREAEYFPGMEGQFEMASGRTIPDTVVMVTLEDQTTSKPGVVDRAITMFDVIRGYAVSVAESRDIIREAIAKWNSQQR